PLATVGGGLFIGLPRQVIEELVLDDALVEFRILPATTLAGIVHEEFALPDAGRGERVGLDDIRAGFEEAAVDIANHLRLREREKIAVVEQILLRFLEPLAPDVRFLHLVAANGRAHRSVEDRDAFPEELLQWAGGMFYVDHRLSSPGASGRTRTRWMTL